MREAWRPLLFAVEELGERTRTRDPVAAAEPSASAKRKKATRRAEFELDTQLSAEHARALELLKGIRV